ncbi:MAG: hypothetical protein II812_02500 [Prevotella sp.]|nr:hypothetical protein [Prevotella sp.]
MGFKKLFFGERMPDRDDPRYQELHQRSYNAGRRFGESIGLPWLGEKIYLVTSRHKKLFFISLFSGIIFFLCLKTYSFVRAVNRVGSGHRKTAVERVDSAMEHRYDNRNSYQIPYNHD